MGKIKIYRRLLSGKNGEHYFLTDKELDSAFFQIVKSFDNMDDAVTYCENVDSDTVVSADIDLWDDGDFEVKDKLPHFIDTFIMVEHNKTYFVYAGYYELFITDKKVESLSNKLQGEYLSVSDLECALEYQLPEAESIFVDVDCVFLAEYFNVSGSFKVENDEMCDFCSFNEEISE